MARAINRRREAERERAERYDAILRQPRAHKTPDSDALVRAVVEGRTDRIVRDPGDWRVRLKTKDRGRLALAVARHAFALFPVPQHLEGIWLTTERLDPREVERRKDWYVDVAQGLSLYKGRARGTLTKAETHRFLNPPAAGLGFRQALWFAVALSYTDNVGVALRIARSKIARDDVSPFWRDAARFFCANPMPVAEIDDLCDFLEDRRRENPAYGLEGRTARSLRMQMEAWHRDLGRVRNVGTGSWEGSPLPDWSWEQPNVHEPPNVVRWSVTQIKTGQDLAAEGNAMRHCVYSYKQQCTWGWCSIWSLRTRTGAGFKRVLTMEMTPQNEVIQIRGLANRPASAAELAIVRRWAIARGVTVNDRPGPVRR